MTLTPGTIDEAAARIRRLTAPRCAVEPHSIGARIEMVPGRFGDAR